MIFPAEIAYFVFKPVKEGMPAAELEVNHIVLETFMAMRLFFAANTYYCVTINWALLIFKQLVKQYPQLLLNLN